MVLELVLIPSNKRYRELNFFYFHLFYSKIVTKKYYADVLVCDNLCDSWFCKTSFKLLWKESKTLVSVCSLYRKSRVYGERNLTRKRQSRVLLVHLKKKTESEDRYLIIRKNKPPHCLKTSKYWCIVFLDSWARGHHTPILEKLSV